MPKKRKIQRRKPSPESIGRLLRKAHRIFNKALEARIAVENVTISMWHYLRELWEEDGIDQRELSRRTGMLETSVVSSIALLEKRGLVWREQDSKDRRRNIVFLTKRGRSLQYLLEPLAREINQITLEGIAKSDEKILRRLLKQITSNLERRSEL